MANVTGALPRILMPFAGKEDDTTSTSGVRLVAGAYALGGAILGSMVTRSRLAKVLSQEEVDRVPPVLKVLF